MSKQDTPRLFLEHLSELRSRILWYILTLIIVTTFSFYFYPSILKLLLLPLHQRLFYTSPAGGLDLTIKLCLLSGFVLSLPVLVYHMLRFIEPALPSRFHIKVSTIIVVSFILTLIGVSFAYFVSLPAALYFLANFGSDQIQSLITTNEYFSFISNYLLGFALFFQLPLILFLINQFYYVKASKLLKFQKVVILVSFIIAAIITPTPDFINQTIMAIPLIALYYVSSFVIYLSNRKIDKDKYSQL